MGKERDLSGRGNIPEQQESGTEMGCERSLILSLRYRSPFKKNYFLLRISKLRISLEGILLCSRNTGIKKVKYSNLPDFPIESDILLFPVKPDFFFFLNTQTPVGVNPSLCSSRGSEGCGIFLFNREAAPVCVGIRAEGRVCSCGHCEEKRDFHPRGASGCLCHTWGPDFGPQPQKRMI